MAFTNCARVYNESLRGRISRLRPANDLKPTPLLDPDHVQDAFIVHALMLDAIRRGDEVRRDSPLTVPNKESLQKDRFLVAMTDRNHRYSAYCWPEFNHVCNLCGEETTRENGRGAHLISNIGTEDVGVLLPSDGDEFSFLYINMCDPPEHCHQQLVTIAYMRMKHTFCDDR